MRRIALIMMLWLASCWSIASLAQGNDGTYGRGADKKEADDRISGLLEQVKGSWQKIALPTNAQLRKVDGKDYCLLPGDTFMIESVNSETYYKLGTERVEAVFDSLHVKESIANLLMQKVDMSDMEVEVLHRKYGLYLPAFQVRWADLLTVLLDRGYKCYSAVQVGKNQNQVTGVLIVNHPSRGYIHLLMLSIHTKALFARPTEKGKGISLSGLLYTNTPYSNVLDLFEERKNN